jgi:hypothetical protein
VPSDDTTFYVSDHFHTKNAGNSNINGGIDKTGYIAWIKFVLNEDVRVHLNADGLLFLHSLNE